MPGAGDWDGTIDSRYKWEHCIAPLDTSMDIGPHSVAAIVFAVASHHRTDIPASVIW